MSTITTTTMVAPYLAEQRRGTVLPCRHVEEQLRALGPDEQGVVLLVLGAPDLQHRHRLVPDVYLHILFYFVISKWNESEHKPLLKNTYTTYRGQQYFSSTYITTMSAFGMRSTWNTTTSAFGMRSIQQPQPWITFSP